MLFNYPNDISRDKIDIINRYAKLKTELGAKGVDKVLEEIVNFLEQKKRDLDALPIDSEQDLAEPDDLDAIRERRPVGVRKMQDGLPADYVKRLKGALLGRFAGCSLGAPVEGNSIESMSEWAKYIGDEFPPKDYWSRVDRPNAIRYKVSLCEDFSKTKMRCVPSDDDIGYTILGLLILEEYGPDFSVADVAAAWQKYLVRECTYTAERITLDNLVRGIGAEKAGKLGNYDCQLIGADIRCDPWAYVLPGKPEKAAELAWRDASLSHSKNGIYGAMYFAAAISAAFAVDDPMQALHIGLSEIPKDCTLARELRWALDEAPRISNYLDASLAVSKRYGGMIKAHTINNAVLTVWGINIGRRDFTKVISETVAMSYDNDCTAATAGSLVGACINIDNIPKHWYEPFNDQVKIFLNDNNDLSLSDLVKRFEKQASLMQGK